MFKPLPPEYRFLSKEPGPKVLLEALKSHGLVEAPGPANNAHILDMAREAGLAGVYRKDETPWCGLAMAAWAVRAGYLPPDSPLWALNWKRFGTEQKQAMLGDVLVYTRKTSTGVAGHVGLYVGEAYVRGKLHYATLGGNQDDQVCVRLLPAARCVAIRRSPFKIGQPSNVRPIALGSAGLVSKSEA